MSLGGTAVGRAMGGAIRAISIAEVSANIVACGRCPRLRRYCQAVGRERRAAYADQTYWAKPVPGFGDPDARLWIIGLAPAAHGANRTGRIFTGDRSGDFLFAALHRAGYANQPISRSVDDGLVLRDCFISASARCAPPGNRPLPVELRRCEGYLDAEWGLLNRKRVILALGKIAWDAATRLCERQGMEFDRQPFAHGAIVKVAPSLRLLGSYHVSQQNTFTGKLTPAMVDEILRVARHR